MWLVLTPEEWVRRHLIAYLETGCGAARRRIVQEYPVAMNGAPQRADVVVVAGCGIHADGEEEARHNGIHRFFVGKGAKVVYEEKHVGTGASTGNRHIDPVTEAF